MYFIPNKIAASALAAALSVIIPLRTPIMAQVAASEATLAHNEQAAQCAIVSAPRCRQAGSADHRGTVADPLDPVGLAYNERAAQRAIVTPPIRERSAQSTSNTTTAAVTLADNELAAQHAIVAEPIHTPQNPRGPSAVIAVQQH